MQENKNNAINDVKEGGIGRTHGAAGAQEHQKAQNDNSQPDISEIDQQEGNMNHGTIGGNFDTPDHNAASDKDTR